MINFTPISIEDMKEFIKSLPSKGCELGPIAAILLKDVLDETAPLIADMVNTSLTQGTFHKNSIRLFSTHF